MVAMSPPSTSITLLQRVRDVADQAAWGRFVELYTPLLYRWTVRNGLAEQDARDVVQEVFVTLVRELPGFEYDPRRGSFRGWLKTVTIHRCQERQRLRQPPQIGSGARVDWGLPAPDAVEEFWDREYREELVRRACELMRAEFEETTWRACWEHAVNGRRAAEVAEELGLSENAVYLAKFRVMRRLREELHGLWE
jgi:RNA polymerase sigma-70 factor (ECF subfamily)